MMRMRRLSSLLLMVCCLHFCSPFLVPPARNPPSRELSNNAQLFVSYTQVISDVDDTLKSSGGVQVAGVALGGIDVQYPRGEIYPGVAEFMLFLSLKKGSTLVPPKVAILTARAEELKEVLQLKPTSKLAQAFIAAGESNGISGWGLGPVLYGSVAEWILQVRNNNPTALIAY